MGECMKKNKDMKFKNKDSLKAVQNVIDEANAAVNDKSRTIAKSKMPDVLNGVAKISSSAAGAIGLSGGKLGKGATAEVVGGTLGVGAGGAISFAALYAGGITGLGAAGITSGLAAAGILVGGSIGAGLVVLTAPVVVCSAIGVGVASHIKHKKLQVMKELCYKEAVAKQNAIIKALREETSADKERIECLNALNLLLQAAINDLKQDLGIL